ncbi:hypothetical protein [Rhizobium ruizarguesonis]|uniref:hypothetical protein n=1 Tax=Rhizobium ruizarguesonis TaxID=2081791 RepID=UPI001FDEB2C8|nr:hypothetical protein [Rhizobium ruizarguesonis]WSH03872.1 hypothetical protein U8P71_09735 [Rhizobium ruizarguesonis]
MISVTTLSIARHAEEGENRLRAAVDALEDATFAKLLALLEELGNLSLEEAEIFFRKKNEIWEMTSGDPEFPAEKTFKTVEELAASADPETGFPPSGV